jgi:hypothetical protein
MTSSLQPITVNEMRVLLENTIITRGFEPFPSKTANALQHAKRFGKAAQASVVLVRKVLRSDECQLRGVEGVMLANMGPVSQNEAEELVPSLHGYEERRVGQPGLLEMLRQIDGAQGRSPAITGAVRIVTL